MVPCNLYGDLAVCSPGKGKEFQCKNDPWEAWCFSCRKRTTHAVFGWVENEPSYYGPNYYTKCLSCKARDSDLFPGRVRTWEDDDA